MLVFLIFSPLPVLVLFFNYSEFSKEEFRVAKVDPIYQFSKPITVQASNPTTLVPYGSVFTQTFVTIS